MPPHPFPAPNAFERVLRGETPRLPGMGERYLVFTGRPNSGKSSIIRRITGLRTRSGKRPGTTRRENIITTGDDGARMRNLNEVYRPPYKFASESCRRSIC